MGMCIRSIDSKDKRVALHEKRVSLIKSAIQVYVKSLVRKGLFLESQFNTSRFYAKGNLPKGLILQYHAVSDPRESFAYVPPGLTTSPARFAEQVRFLMKHYEVMPFERLLYNLLEGVQTRRIPVAITFDDGYRNNYDYAFPILKEYGATALFYLTTGCMGGDSFWPSRLRYLILQARTERFKLAPFANPFQLSTPDQKLHAIRKIKGHLVGVPRNERESLLVELQQQCGIKDMTPMKHIMLTWDQVREMRKEGMEFGAHTATHPSLPYIPRTEAFQEILQSKLMLQEQIQEEIKHFSFPNPGGQMNYNEELKRLVQHVGFKSAVTSRKGYASSRMDLFELKRQGIYGSVKNIPDFYFCITKELMMAEIAGIDLITSVLKRAEE